MEGGRSISIDIVAGEKNQTLLSAEEKNHVSIQQHIRARNCLITCVKLERNSSNRETNMQRSGGSKIARPTRCYASFDGLPELPICFASFFPWNPLFVGS